MSAIRAQREDLELQQLASWGTAAKHSAGRERAEEPCPIRTVFQRDIDRLTHSKAFRRLMHKTQVFLSPEGDHYRTRMTHTLEVTRIARTIARALSLNEDLTEAIALGHDLGHTPFGHAGERAMAKLMPGGFHHNVQSLRVVERLERSGAGLNLTAEVREGILCHTGEKKSKTPEGQIVRIADRIAYLNHDMDDALRAGILYPMDLPMVFQERLGFSYSKRISTLILDVVEASSAAGAIRQSTEMAEVMDALRAFMFESVYRNPIAKGEEHKAEALIVQLFSYYTAEVESLPPDYQSIALEEGNARAACDYIAGMTDSFALECYESLFLPRSWTVK